MSQAGYTPIQLYFSTTAAAVPVNTNLANGELAINITDGKLYYKNNAGVVTLLASTAASSPVLSFSAGTTGFTPSTATTGAITLAGTLATTNGGTGLTSFTSGGAVYATSTSALTTGTLPNTAGGTGQSSAFTANGVVYASSTSALATGSALTFDGSTLALTGVQTITNSSGSTLTLDRTSNPGSLQFNFGGTQTGQIQAVSGGGLVFYQGSTPAEGMRLTSTGLGIGTSSPSSKLHVAGSILATGSGSALRVNEDGSSTKVISIRSNFSSNGPAINVETADPLLLQTSNTERMRIASDGKVGIAVTDVRAVLQIGSGNGGGNVPTTSKLMFGANNSIVTFLSASDAASVDGEIGSWSTVYNHQNAKIVFDKPTGNTGQILFYTQAGVGITERFRIGSAGQIGLSGANYGTSGQVLTSGGSGAAPTWTTVGGGSSQWTTSGSDIYYNTGNVAVKTTTFSSIGGTVGTLTIGGTNANTSGGIAYQTNGTVKGYHYIDFDNMTHQSISGGHLFFASNTEKMRITSAGNVGVGTSAPTSLLHTSGALCVGGTGGSGTNGTVTLTKINNGTFDVTMGLSGGNDPGLIQITAVQNDYSGASFGFLNAYYFVAQASVVTPATSSTATGTTFTVSFTNLTSTSYRVTVTQSRQQMSVSVTVLGARNIT